MLQGYGHFDSFLGQQTRRDTLSHLVTFYSRASPLVRVSERYSPSKTFSRLSDRDSRPPISAEAANSDRVVPTPRDSTSYLQGLGDARDRHVCHSVELPPTTAHVSNSGPTSHSGRRSVSSLEGEVNVGQCTCFPPFSLLNRVFFRRSHSDGRDDSHSPWWPNQLCLPHLLRLCVEHPLILPYRRDLLSPQNQKYISDEMSYHLMLSCDTIRQQGFQTRSLGSQQLLGGPQPIACTTIGGFASFNGCRARF